MTAGGSSAACLLRLPDAFGAMQGVLGKLLVGTYSGAVVSQVWFLIFYSLPVLVIKRLILTKRKYTNCLEVVLVMLSQATITVH